MEGHEIPTWWGTKWGTKSHEAQTISGKPDLAKTP
jgi:hypothetical protein